jgi:hypothetical protein
MKKAIAVIFDPIVDVKHMAEFEEVIRSNYVSKRGKENVFILALNEEQNSKDIHDFILSKCSFKPSLLVIKMEYFYGMFQSNDFIEWFKGQFSHMDWLE